MIRYKIVLPFSIVTTVAVMSLGVVIAALINLTLTDFGSGNEFKIQLSAGAASLYAVIILACCMATFLLFRRR